ncbi:MAG: hypothetical protein CMQ61_00005, partial [Gammaproteobacteria bacterium]|nr:hypothetical protein [Gammaproteobacteria bacterium]
MRKKASFKRKAELQQRRAISQSEYDAAVAKADEAKAGVAAAQARVEAARVRLRCRFRLRSCICTHRSMALWPTSISVV